MRRNTGIRKGGCRVIGLLLLLSAFLLPCPCTATILALVCGAERDYLAGSFAEAQSTIDVRCIAIEEPALVAALKLASERGVRVRVVVDTVSPGLRQAVETGNSNFEVRVLSPQNQRRFLAENSLSARFRLSFAERKPISARVRRYLQKRELGSRVEMDGIREWQGAARWSASAWVDYSVLVIHTRYPDDKQGTPSFLRAWQNSRTPEVK